MPTRLVLCALVVLAAEAFAAAPPTVYVEFRSRRIPTWEDFLKEGANRGRFQPNDRAKVIAAYQEMIDSAAANGRTAKNSADVRTWLKIIDGLKNGKY